MKKDIHPAYVDTEVTCTCGNTFTTRSTSRSGSLHADVHRQDAGPPHWWDRRPGGGYLPPLALA